MLNRQDDARHFSVLETCHYGVKSLFENNPNKDLISRSVLKDVKKKTFAIESINIVKVMDGNQCDIVVKDAKGFRSYLVILEKNSNFPHFYKIADVREQKLVSSYQWEYMGRSL